jgi:hypothetical protein
VLASPLRLLCDMLSQLPEKIKETQSGLELVSR